MTTNIINIINSVIHTGVELQTGRYGIDLTITGSGGIFAPNDAVYSTPLAPPNPFTVVNDGLISAKKTGINLAFAYINNAASIAGGINGVALYGAVLNNTGAITGGDVGLILEGQNDVSNFGLVSAASTGVLLAGVNALNNYGQIDGGISGGRMIGNGQFANVGAIAGGTQGVLVEYGFLKNLTGGLISGNQFGVNLHPDTLGIGSGFQGAHFYNFGTVHGGVTGVTLQNWLYVDENIPASLRNFGSIIGTEIGVSEGSGTVYSSGSISGGAIGVYLNTGNLTDTGAISGATYSVYGTGQFGLALVPSSVLSGKVKDRSGTGVLSLSGVTSNTLAGIGTTIAGFNQIDFANYSTWAIEGNVAGLASGQVINAQTFAGIILQSFVATYGTYALDHGFRITNGAVSETLLVDPAAYRYLTVYAANGNSYIEIHAPSQTYGVGLTPGDTSTIAGFNAVELTPGESDDAAVVTISATGTVAAIGAPSVYLPSRISNASIINNGKIVSLGQYDAVKFKAAETLVNDGIISGVTGSGIDPDHGVIMQGGTIQNTGEIYGGISAPGATLYNSGKISGGVDHAVLVNNTGSIYSSGYFGGVNLTAGSLVNSGQIGGRIAGVVVRAYIGDQAFLTNFGTITSADEGISLTQYYRSGGPDRVTNNGYVYGKSIGLYAYYGGTVINSGTLAGGMYSVDNNSESPLYLTVTAGGHFDGAVQSRGNAHLILAGTAAGTLDLGDSFSGFSSIDFSNGSSWTLAGAVSALAEGQTILGFTFGDALIVEGFAAASASYTAGTGLVLTDGSDKATLDILNLTSYYSLAAGFGLTTISANISKIEKSLTAEITPGASACASAITVTSTGILTAPAGVAFYAAASISNAALTNAGTISGLVEFENAAQITNTGTISGAFGLALHDGGDVTDSGLISGIFPAIENLAGDLNLTLNPGAAFHGEVVDNPGTGTLTLSGQTPGSIDLGTSFTGFSSVDFANAWTVEGATEEFSDGQTINGFFAGDTLRLDNFAATSQTIGISGLTLSNATAAETLDITGISQFTVADNANGGTDITTSVACFCRGTRIATPRGNIEVENLKIGDLVTTLHGDKPIRWIGRRAYANHFIANNRDALPIRIRRHAIALNIPSRNLYVSPDHAIAEGGVLIHAHLLQNGTSIHQPNTTKDIEYFHFEFDTHTVIFAENLSVESFIDEGAGNRFQNSHTRIPRTKPQKPCLPRVFQGFHLHNIKSRIAARAGIHAPTTLGALQGVIDELTPTLIRGWAQNSAAPEHPVTLEIISGAQKYLVLANTFRPDLRAAGLGSGCHGFSLTLPNLQHPITLRRALDQAPLPDIGWVEHRAFARRA